jgi:hypothetical protein
MINLRKPKSLYNEGMQPLIYSTKSAKPLQQGQQEGQGGSTGRSPPLSPSPVRSGRRSPSAAATSATASATSADENCTATQADGYGGSDGCTGKGWFRGGFDVSYYANGLKRGSKSYFSLSFTYRFEHDDDRVFFAYCYPYTYTHLQHYLADVDRDERKSTICKRRKLCNTLAGNRCDLLTITAPLAAGLADNPEALRAARAELKRRKGIVLSARIHPGETNSSWMMKGVVRVHVISAGSAFRLRLTHVRLNSAS